MKTKFYLSFLTLIGLGLIEQNATAQTYQPSNRIPVADNTLGTQVSGNGGNFNITGGLNKGQTLFHSFTDFSIPTNGQTNFLNPAGTRDIITRVTGNLFSDLNGTLNSSGANFLLINPNGVVFGNNAQLNVGKAFTTSTANGVDLIDGSGNRYTFGTNGAGDTPLLNVNPNVLFTPTQLIMGSNSGQISNFGTLQTTNNGQYIGLIGGKIVLDGGKIVAPGGRIDLGALTSVGTVSTDTQGLIFGGSGLIYGDISFVNGAAVSARATEALAPVNTFNNAVGVGSNVNISANNLSLINAGDNISATGVGAIDTGLDTNSGTQTAATGNINIKATGLVALDNSRIKNTLRTGASGQIGDINIQAKSVNLSNDSGISTILTGKGSGGNIGITTTGDVSISGTNDPSLLQNGQTAALSGITSGTQGQGDAGKISINTQAQGNLLLFNLALISSSVGTTATGNGGDINISAKSIDLRSNGNIFARNSGGTGNAGNIKIKTTGDISISGSTPQSTDPITANSLLSSIASDTTGKGNAGSVTIDTQNRGKLSLSNLAQISSNIASTGVGDSGGVSISAKSVDLTNGSSIDTSNVAGTGNAGNIQIDTIGDISLNGSIAPGSTSSSSVLSGLQTTGITSNSSGIGNAGKITIDTHNLGKLLLANQVLIGSSVISVPDLNGVKSAVGNGGDISISAKSIDLQNQSFISTFSGARGNAGNINIKTAGDISIFGSTPQSTVSRLSGINSFTAGTGNAGKITIDTQNLGKLSLSSVIISSSVGLNGVGNGGDISISAKSIDLQNQSSISSLTGGKGNAGDINIKTAGDISISGSTPSSTIPIASTSPQSVISSQSSGQGNAGKVKIDTQNLGKLSLNRGSILSGVGPTAAGNGGDLSISAKSIDLTNRSLIGSSNTSNQGKTGDIALTADRVTLNNSFVVAESIGNSGGNIQFNLNDLLLMRNNSEISTTSVSTLQNGNGGNLRINSPLIVAASGNSDITANANGGNGGRVNITSQGLFGIQYRPNAADASPSTNDITASSTFGQSGAVNISTPGVDPGKDSTQLQTVPNDTTNQISQVCSANTRENKLIVTGRGGLPPTANDPLTSDVVWQDARTTSSQPVASNGADPAKLVPPAVGWVFDGKGKVTLVAASTQGQPTKTNVVCPSIN